MFVVQVKISIKLRTVNITVFDIELLILCTRRLSHQIK